MYIPPTFMFDMLVFIWSHILENLVFADPVIKMKNQIVRSYVRNIYTYLLTSSNCKVGDLPLSNFLKWEILRDDFLSSKMLR